MMKKYDEKILLVDDDSKNLQVAMNILKDYNVIFAQSGEKALSLIEENSFDLILLDIVMPTMNGYEVCKKIKQNKKTRKTPLIFLTVKDEEKDIVKGFELGAVDYVIKPFFSDVLLKRVEVHLKLANAMKNLEDMNNNLNEIVDEQILQIRQKDEIIHRQAKIAAIFDVIDLISSQWKLPLDKLKLYLQSLSLMLENQQEANNIHTNALLQVKELDKVMKDFHKFFNNKKNKENVNIKVVLDNVLINLKDRIDRKKINVEITGNNLLTLNIVNDELMHIFTNLLECSISNFKKRMEKEDNFISVLIEEGNDSLYITYEDNSKVYRENEISNLFEVHNNSITKEFDLGFYLIKVFVEKNKGMILVKATKDGIKYVIRFDK